jgi:hypothetical protein
MRKQISEIIIGDRVEYAGKFWRVCDVKKQRSSLFNVVLYSEETGERTTLRKVPGAVTLEVVG